MNGKLSAISRQPSAKLSSAGELISFVAES
jgi:hypothetical protein